MSRNYLNARYFCESYPRRVTAQKIKRAHSLCALFNVVNTLVDILYPSTDNTTKLAGENMK
jgi:hypothetical protein